MIMIIIIIMYIYQALTNALSAHMIHINLNMIFYTYKAQSYQNNLHKILYGKTNTHTHTHTHTLTVALLMLLNCPIKFIFVKVS